MPRLLLSLLVGLLCACAQAIELPKATPESQGLDSARLTRMLDYLQSNGFDTDCVLLARHGQLVLESYAAPFQPGTAHQINSAAKSFTSTLAGLAIAEGKLSLDDTVAKVLPQYADIPNARAITLRQLLGMQSGVFWSDLGDWGQARHSGDWQRFMLQLPRPPELIGKWNYNSAGSDLIGAMVAQSVHMPLEDYARQKLFEPLGFGKVDWDQNGKGQVDGSRGIYAQPKDLLAFAELFRQHGNLGGKQLVPRQWVDYATAPLYPVSSDSPHTAFYGAQWWTTRNGDWYAAEGAGGQYIVVLPQEDISLVIASRRYYLKAGPIPDFDALLQYFIRPAAAAALPDNPAARAALNQRIAQLAHPAPVAVRHPAQEALLDGKAVGSPQANKDSWQFRFGSDQVEVLQIKGGAQPGRYTFKAALDGTWHTNTIDGQPQAARAFWIDDHTLALEQVWLRSGIPFNIRFAFNGDHVHIDVKDQAAGIDAVVQAVNTTY